MKQKNDFFILSTFLIRNFDMKNYDFYVKCLSVSIICLTICVISTPKFIIKYADS